MTEISFCSKCGTQLGEESVFCSKCGKKILESVPKIHPLENTKLSVFGNKFGIVSGAIFLIVGVAISNGVIIFLGASSFAVGFISLKTKSKTIRQLMVIIQLIVTAIAIINMINVLS